jgi:ubiquinone/menaquinone biosynthesis C-methylase UbiE
MTTTPFKDYFSKLAQGYARYRPRYPQSLFEYLASLIPEGTVAWDCATGNGQVALNLTNYFQQVYATDASPQQIDQAFQHERIYYQVAPAERTELADHSVDLVTVGQALHWFNLEQFYREVRRVTKPTGIVAVWCYGFFEIPGASESIHQALQDFLALIEPFWTPERDLVIQHYQTIPFPFEEVVAPTFEMGVDWTIHHLIGYLSTWSAVHLFSEQEGMEAIASACKRLENAWGDPETTQPIQWQIHSRIGRVV